MDTVDILREGVVIALKLGAPMLILSMLVGILVAIFQAVTQIHEQSLSFIFMAMPCHTWQIRSLRHGLERLIPF